MFPDTKIQVRRILVVGPSWVGDMIMAQSLFKTLKSLHPAAHIDVLAPDWSHPVLARMPEVTESIAIPFAHGELNIRKRIALGRALRKKAYSHCFVLPNSFKSAILPAAAGIPVRVGWRGEMRFGLLNDIRLLNEMRYPRMVQRFCALAYPAGADLPTPLPQPELHIDSQSLAQSIGAFHLSVHQPVLALCPGAEFGPSKQWPTEHFAAVARQRLEQGYHVWILGSKNDVATASEIKNQIPSGLAESVHVLAGKTTLAQCIDLMSAVTEVVTNDSGLMHIAAALDKPLVAVYGSTSPDFTPPLNDRAKIARIPIGCAPCFKRVCPLRHHKCMKELKPEQVLTLLKELPRE